MQVFCALSGVSLQQYLCAIPSRCPAQEFGVLATATNKGVKGYDIELENLSNIASVSVATLAIDPEAWAPNHVQAGREVVIFPEEGSNEIE